MYMYVLDSPRQTSGEGRSLVVSQARGEFVCAQAKAVKKYRARASAETTVQYLRCMRKDRKRKPTQQSLSSTSQRISASAAKICKLVFSGVFISLCGLMKSTRAKWEILVFVGVVKAICFQVCPFPHQIHNCNYFSNKTLNRRSPRYSREIVFLTAEFDKFFVRESQFWDLGVLMKVCPAFAFLGWPTSSTYYPNFSILQANFSKRRVCSANFLLESDILSGTGLPLLSHRTLILELYTHLSRIIYNQTECRRGFG